MRYPVQPRPLILASTSPRRRELLAEHGYDFEAAAPPFEELESLPHVTPVAHAESLAYFKATSVSQARPDATVIGADTIATIDGEIIGKPRDRADARRILATLSGTSHQVITGVALVSEKENRRWIDHAVTTIRVRPLSNEMIESYLNTGLWEGKAGAYGIQDKADPFVEAIDGSYSNVVGLPMELLTRGLREWVGGVCV